MTSTEISNSSITFLKLVDSLEWFLTVKHNSINYNFKIDVVDLPANSTDTNISDYIYKLLITTSIKTPVVYTPPVVPVEEEKTTLLNTTPKQIK